MTNSYPDSEDISNPGSALGEAIGTLLEERIHSILEPLAQAKGCIYIKTGSVNPQTNRTAKLILTDKDGNDYNIDSVIINRRFQPLVLVESKYIRYKKHNRDKASWICTAHTKLRQQYVTVRKSIAILMGSWSRPSKRLLQSFEVELFEVAFNDIADALREHGIEYAWAEKDRQQAAESWSKFTRTCLALSHIWRFSRTWNTKSHMWRSVLRAYMATHGFFRTNAPDVAASEARR